MNIDAEIESLKQKIELLEQKKSLIQGKQLSPDHLHPDSRAGRAHSGHIRRRAADFPKYPHFN